MLANHDAGSAEQYLLPDQQDDNIEQTDNENIDNFIAPADSYGHSLRQVGTESNRGGESNMCFDFVNSMLVADHGQLQGLIEQVTNDLIDRTEADRTITGEASLVKYIQDHQNSLILSPDPPTTGQLFLVKHHDFTNLFRVLAAQKKGENIELLYDRCSLQNADLIKYWDVGNLDFTYYAYQSVLGMINDSSNCLIIENNFFYCNDHNHLISMIEETILQRLIASFT